MIQYEYSVYNCAFLFRIRGSVFPFACLVALPCTLAATLMKSFGTYHDLELSSLELLAEGGSGAWSGFNFLVGFVIVFRTSQAYTRFWNALTDTHQMMAAWLEAASSVVAFSRSSSADPLLIENWLHTVIRLFSLLSASALQELTDVAYHQTWGLPTLDASAIDPLSIQTLDASSCRVELLYHWIQQFVCDGIQLGILSMPPPLLKGGLAELARGMDHYQDAMKHSKIAFPFPYAQTTLMLLIFHWILTPLVMVQWTNTVFGSGIFTFVQVFTLWCLNATAVGFERPFGGEANDIDHIELQMAMNKSLINLMDPKSRRLPFIPASTFLDIDVLRKRDTIHSAALHQEGWQLKDLDTAGTAFQAICAACCRRQRPQTHRSMIAVSTRYSSKRYCVIEGQRTAALTVGIVGSELCLALPALPNDTRSTFKVLNVSGQLCTLRVKRIPIQQRHLLTKVPDPSWNEDYLDFPPDYNFAADVLANACDTQKGSRASVALTEEDGQDIAKAITRGVSKQLRDSGLEETPEAEKDSLHPVLPGSVQDAHAAHPAVSMRSDAEKTETVFPSSGGSVSQAEPSPRSQDPGQDPLRKESPRKEGPHDMVLPWGSLEADQPHEEEVPPEGGQILPWGAAAEAADTGPKVDKDAVEAVAQAVQEQSDAQPFDLETEIQTKEEGLPASLRNETPQARGMVNEEKATSAQAGHATQAGQAEMAEITESARDQCGYGMPDLILEAELALSGT